MKNTHLVLILLITTLTILTGCNNETNVNSNTQPNTPTNLDSAAHWLSDTIIVVGNSQANTRFELQTKLLDGRVQLHSLTATNLPQELVEQYPHLSSFMALQVPSQLDIKAALKGHNQVIQYQAEQLIKTSNVQIYGVLDFVYTANENDANEENNYGATIYKDSDKNTVTFKLWAPTATKLNVLLFDKNHQAIGSPLTMTEDNSTGIWSVTTSEAKPFDYYQYQLDVYHPISQKFETLTTTDPYSLSLSTNSKYSQIIDLNNPDTFPKGWLTQTVANLNAPEDLILYETHIRDFSASEQQLSNPAFKGKYKAFSETNTDGIQHLTMLKKAGLNTIHLLPTYDISTVDEDTNSAIDLNDSMTKVCQLYPQLSHCNDQDIANKTLKQLLASFDTRGSQAQDVMERIRAKDNYNWGYDPYHYTVPEGSYAVNPEGESRIIEFREMVTSLHNLGFRVIMDVVYNHTFASGLNDKSVLDKVVPGYYHRYDPISGVMEISTCCDNSATEHAMMEKLMTDSLIVWSRDHKIDGFRFDLMGHQPKQAMLNARKAVQQVDPDTYFYGEGWNFGEVANNKQFIQASQYEMAGTEIGTFTDRLRDAIRGGNYQTNAEGLRRDQGIGNGLLVIPNDLQQEDKQLAHYQVLMDVVRLGLAGNLQNFPLQDSVGDIKLGKDINYGGSPAGYALDPADTINYVSKHDNQSLWDNHQYRLPYSMESTDRVRIQNMSLAYPLMAQGIPFLHMGAELLRSKSFLRDSYDYGDWFNAVDFSKQNNNYDVGLPPAEKDKANWPIISTVLNNNQQRDHVSATQIEFAANVFAEFINIRASSVLFRLRSEKDVIDRVQFHNTGEQHQAGLIVMSLSDEIGEDLDPNIESIVVIFNNNQTAQQVEFNGAEAYHLHPSQLNGVDTIVQTSVTNKTGFNIAPLSVAVFVK
ncbi:hypothetical protein GCM10008107_11870 [Psychrosphaera saromensis]|uniref:Alpha-amylase n=1 Tax=Psychrosphaera saromensis TaxID=716813 RepID=A0A2S7UUE0_9GAMM|nr:pullulanase-type alpha-1,6-glucosidase [Psychrosphaera saromensis]PQJ53553.1 alpha-amylase [Psychrosphaera saromensis]GHB64356.1 hypothetical protein GCM10008107_11870 [Psychrosphaera saromensis]GLQ15690.1 hypothetical protein GCM10007917_31450 [Psychrosphaera saromensis]